MKRLKVLKTIILTLIIVLSMQFNVFAAEFKTETTANKKEIKKGEQVVVTLSFKDYKDIGKGLNAYKATLQYDKNLFEEVEQSDFQTLNSWEELLYNPDNGEFVSIKKAGSMDDESVVKITLKAKSDIRPETTTITIKDVTASEGKEDITTNESNAKVDLIYEDDENIPGGGNQGDNGNNSGSNQGGEQDNIADGKLPHTGISPMFSFILIAIQILIVIAIIYRIKIKKIDKKMSKGKKLFIAILLTGVIGTQLVGTIYAVTGKGELNDDGIINYKDVTLLEQHLINLKKLPDEKLKNADINSDNKITVTDLTLLVQKIEKNLDYTVELSSSIDNYYPNKNEEIDLKFSAVVSYDAKIEEVTINGENYKVEPIKESDDYIVKINVGQTPGIKEFNFTKVKLDVGKEVKVKFTEKVDVLKEQPTIENYEIIESIEDAKLKVQFTVRDSDSSVTGGHIELLEKLNDGNTKTVQEENITVGNMSDTLFKVAPAVTDQEKFDINRDVKNVYELNTATGISNSKVCNVIKEVTLNDLKNANFYINTMNWSNEIWDFSEVALGNGPKLK